MSSRSPALLALPLLLAGCLTEGAEPQGIHLFHGQTLVTPGFMRVGEDTVVRFQDRRLPATTTRGAVSDLWISSFDGTSQRKVVSDWSENWPEEAYSAHERYYMVEERLVDTAGGKARVADLIRLGPTMEEEFRLAGVWAKARFTVPMAALFAAPQPGQTCPGFPHLADNCPQIIFERPVPPGQTLPTLMLWDGEQEIPLGLDAGSFQVQPMGGTLYFIRGEGRTLTRFVRPLNLMDSLRTGITRFSISGDERYAAVALTEEGKAKTVILDLVTKTEIDLARPNPSAWGGFGQDEFTYAQNATSTSPAELHRLNLLTGEDTFVTLPSPLQNLAGWLDRPNSDERLLLDSNGRGVFTGQNDLVARRVLAGPLYTPKFTDDGSYLVYIERAASTLYDTTVQGALMFQDAELAEPPVMVSPPGMLVSAQSGYAYFFTEGNQGTILVFWAHLGRGSSDLHFADYHSGKPPINMRLMARAILSVSISAHSLFGIINMSQQDAVGDLVIRNFDTGVDRLIAQGVSEAAEHRDEASNIPYAAYILRGREESERSGLWLTTLTPPATPEEGSE